MPHQTEREWRAMHFERRKSRRRNDESRKRHALMGDGRNSYHYGPRGYSNNRNRGHMRKYYRGWNRRIRRARKAALRLSSLMKQ